MVSPSCIPSPVGVLPLPFAGGSTTIHAPFSPLPSDCHPNPQPHPHPQEQGGISGNGSGDAVRQVMKKAREGRLERGRQLHKRKWRPQDQQERAPPHENQLHSTPRMVAGSSPAAASPTTPVFTAAGTPSLVHMKTREVSSSKRLRSPMVQVPVKSTGVRMLLSPKNNSPSPSVMRTKKSRKRRKLTSEIWKDFDAIYDGQSVAEAQCIHCHKIIKVARDVGTSTCLRHLRICEGKARVDQMLNQITSNDQSSLSASLKDWKFDQGKAQKELAYLIVVHALPFSLVEYPRFRSFVNSLNPWFTHISRTTIKSDCMDEYEHGKAELLEVLKKSTSRVSLTADLWTSKQTLGYLCVTCHFIRNWKVCKVIIKFGLVETPHDGRNLFNAMLKCLNEWSIEDKIFAITLDNASVNNNFVSALKENLVAKCLLPGEGTMFHCRCAAHILNLIVQEGLLAMKDAVTSIRDSVKYVKSSQGRKERFEKMIKEVGISCDKRPPLDVATRWNSTYHMLKCALEYEKAFEALNLEDSQYVHQPLVREWKMAKKLCDILKTFCDATEVLSGSNYPTASYLFDQFWEVKMLLEKESSDTDIMIAAMIHKMKEKFQKYWDLCFLQICVPVILDPRFKLGFLDFRLSKCFGESSKYFPLVEKTFRDLFDEYNSHSSEYTHDYAESISTVETYVGRTNPWADWSLHQNLNQRRRVSELDKYLQEETVPTDAPFDILQYWKTSSATYPILAHMARDILAVPASTVASESAFSSGEKIISDYRSRLTSETVEALICLQDWLRGKGINITHDDIAGHLIGDDEDDEDVLQVAHP